MTRPFTVRAWNFGDGNMVAVSPDCLEWTPDSRFMRGRERAYVYEISGTSQASFTYGPLAKTTDQAAPQSRINKS